MIKDKNIEWLEKRVYLPAQAFQTYVTGASVSTGDPVFQEVAATGITGIQIAAAGDAISHAWMVPYDLDRGRQVRFRIWYSQTSTTPTDSVDWTLTYQQILEESTVMVLPATALDTVIPLADLSSGVASQLQASDFGVIARNTLTTTCMFLNLLVVATAIGTYSANEINLMGLEVRYTPRRTGGPEKNLRGGRRLATATPLGTVLHATQEG